MQFFQSKAKTLRNLKKYTKKSTIPSLKVYKVSDYKKNKYKLKNSISKIFLKNVAVRSSSVEEDGNKTTNAGKFKSILNINPKNKKKLSFALNEVIKPLNKNKNNEFFIQSMVNNVKYSGVCFTQSINNSLSGYEINYTKNNKTDIITSGKENGEKIFFIENKKYELKAEFKKLINSIKEIEKITKEKYLDIEFAISNNKIFILQVRKLLSTNSIGKLKTINVINKLTKKIQKLKKKSKSLFGKTTFFGVMPDWNPAEIIGTKPKPLSLSLYKYLITDSVWSENRNKYGYNNVYPFHLLTTFYGTPYVDLRIDFNSWVPSNIPNNLKEKLVNYYLNKFSKNKKSHDKIEFDIVYSCCSFDTKKRIYSELLKDNFKKSEIKIILKNLIRITNNTIKNYNDDYNFINKLPQKQTLVNSSKIYEVDKIFWLLNDCKKYGTLPFAGLARCAFVAIEFLNSLVRLKILTIDEKQKFLSSIKTVTGEIVEDFSKLNKNSFLRKYGHLRPNTYDISVNNYKEGYNYYFNKKKKIKRKKFSKFYFSKKQKQQIIKLIKKNSINLTYIEFINFLRSSIKFREESKFIFTKSIDLIFKNIKRLSKRIGVDYKDFSYVDINSIMDLYNNLDSSDLKDKFIKEIEINKKVYDFNKNIKIPDVISETKDIFISYENDGSANFIGTKRIFGKNIFLKSTKKQKLENKIICIENADPGYDYIFNRKILGLITKYGGVNSHMSIRCSELSIPAAIGIGEKRFEELKNQKFINLDCESKKII